MADQGVGAVARVQQAAGALGDQIRGLQHETDTLISQLDRADSRLGSAARTLERYRGEVAAGKALSEGETQELTRVRGYLAQEGGAAGQLFLAGAAQRTPAIAPEWVGRQAEVPNLASQFYRDRAAQSMRDMAVRYGGAPGPAPSSAAAPPPPTATPPNPPPAPPPQGAAPIPPATPPPSGAGGPGPQPTPESAGPSPTAASVDTSRQAAEATDVHGGSVQRFADRIRLWRLSDRDLRLEWQETTRSIREREVALSGVQRQYDRLGERRDELSQAIAEERDPQRRERLQDRRWRISERRHRLSDREDELRDDLRPLRDRQGELLEEVEARGGSVNAGGGIDLPGVGMLASIGRMGVGGLTVLTASLMGVRAAWNFVREGADEYEQTQRRIFETGMRLGGFQGLRSDIMSNLAGPLRLRPEETLEATLALGMQTGRTDASGVMAFARAYGLPPGVTAQLIGQIGALGYMPREQVDTRRVVDPAAREAALSGALTHMRGDEEAAGPLVNSIIPKIATDFLGTSDPNSWFYDPSLQPGRTKRDVRLEGIAELRDRLRAEPNTANVAILEQQLRELGARTEDDVGTMYRTVETRRGGLPDILAAAYQASSAQGLPERDRDVLMQSFLEQSMRLFQLQAAGGAPIAEEAFGRMPAMLAEASNIYGPHPFAIPHGARLVGSMMQAFSQPQDETMRGVFLRAILERGRQMTPEERERFRAGTEGLVSGGLDLTRYEHARAALESFPAMKGEQFQEIAPALVEAFRGVGGNGQMAEMMLSRMTGSPKLGIELNRYLEKLMSAQQGTPAYAEASQNFIENMAKAMGKMKDAGTEASPFMQETEELLEKLRAGQPLKLLGQAIKDEVLDFVGAINDAHSEWRREVAPMTEGPVR